ncbi:MAG: hypothetical protein LBH08_02330 [Puniceicoccales bacterium]|nr:hypothetical protein [Puniceicoccales bacterium]
MAELNPVDEILRNGIFPDAQVLSWLRNRLTKLSYSLLLFYNVPKYIH